MAGLGKEWVGDLAVERGWITPSRLRSCQEMIDCGATDLSLAALLVHRMHKLAEINDTVENCGIPQIFTDATDTINRSK